MIFSRRFSSVRCAGKSQNGRTVPPLGGSEFILKARARGPEGPLFHP